MYRIATSLDGDCTREAVTTLGKSDLVQGIAVIKRLKILNIQH